MELAERMISPSELDRISSMTDAVITYDSENANPRFIWSFDVLAASEDDSSITAYRVSDSGAEGSSLTITAIDKIRLIAHAEPHKSACVHIYNAGHITELKLKCIEPTDWLTILDT